MRLLPFISEWGPRMWVCVLTPLVSFPLGVWSAGRLFKGGRRESGALRRGEPAGGMILQRKALFTATACLIVGMSALAYEYHLIGEVPVLSENPDVARMKLFGVAGQQDPGFDTVGIRLVHPFVGLNKYAFFLALLVLIQRGTKSRRVLILGSIILLFGALAFGSQGGRGFLVEMAIVSVALVHYLRRRVRLREFSFAAILLFLFIALYGSFRIEKSESAPLFERALTASNLPVGAFWDGIAFGYATVTVSFEVFDRLIDDFRYLQRPPDGFVLYSLHRFIPRSNIQEFAFNLYGGETITATFLGEFYGDYGYLGVLFGPLVLGFGYGWAYSRVGNQKPLYWIYVRGLLLQMLIFFPYVNLFSQYLNWIFDLFFMYFLIRHLAARSQKL
jgi:hypothetical protein